MRFRAPQKRVSAPGGRSFYSVIRKRSRRARAPMAPVTKRAHGERRAAYRVEFAQALKDARDKVQQQATELHGSFGGHTKKYYEQEIMQRGRLERERCKPTRWNVYLREELRKINAERPQGEPKLSVHMVVQEVSKKWNSMNKETQEMVTDPFMEELITAREEADSKAKLVPVHVLNDVTATIGRITRELDALHARTGFETILFGVRSSADHYSAPFVYSPSNTLPKFFSAVMKKPVGDLATALEAYCLSGVDGVIEDLMKQDCQIRVELVNLVNGKLRELTGCKSTRMIYKTFDQSITRKHGIVIDGWPLKRFENPSSIGSKIELEVLLNSWKSGATRFRQMTPEEHIAWIENYVNNNCESSPCAPCPSPSSASPPHPIAVDSNHTATLTPTIHSGLDAQLNTTQSASSATPLVTAGPSVTASLSLAAGPSGVGSKKRKVRSDKGKPRIKATKSAGDMLFQPSMV